MAQMQDVRAAAFPAQISEIAVGWPRLVSSHPVAIFVLLSVLFGALTIALTPPLRGPDEPPHFIRAYGISLGEIVPSTTNAQGRKGIFIPAELHREMQLYELALGALYREENVTYPNVLAAYSRLRAEAPVASGVQAFNPQVFTLYAGSEGYSPVPYLPYLPALALAHLLKLDFLSTFYLMRAAGFVVLTAVMTLAIAIVPHLKWTFVLIGLLPSALFSRAVLSTDGSALACIMVVAALCLRSAYGLYNGGPWMRLLWMTLCVLSKPPQLVFILLEAMRCPLRHFASHWRSSAIVIIPAVALAVLWAAVSSADVAAWRILEGSTRPPEHFEPLWKLRFLVEQPWHFLLLLAGTYHYLDDYWLQLIGILGWLDMPLRPWVYPVLSAVLLATFCDPLELDPRTLRRVAAVAALTVFGYCLAVFLIFYLVWTGLDAVQVEGVQGRYFVVVLPLVAITFAALVNQGLSEPARAWTAIFGAILSGCATLDAVLRADWNLPLLPI